MQNLFRKQKLFSTSVWIWLEMSIKKQDQEHELTKKEVSFFFYPVF